MDIGELAKNYGLCTNSYETKRNETLYLLSRSYATKVLHKIIYAIQSPCLSGSPKNISLLLGAEI